VKQLHVSTTHEKDKLIFSLALDVFSLIGTELAAGFSSIKGKRIAASDILFGQEISVEIPCQHDVSLLLPKEPSSGYLTSTIFFSYI
jgi:hypothetical protein